MTFAAAEEGVTVPVPQVDDLVLQAVGRTPNGKKIAADKSGEVAPDHFWHPQEWLFSRKWLLVKA